MSYLPLPDGLTAEDLEHLDLEQLTREHPAKAMIVADFAMQYHVKNSRTQWIQMANILKHVNDNDLWQHHVENYSTFFEWCNKPEIDISASLASDMMAIARFGDEFNAGGIDIYEIIEEVGPSKVRQLVPMMREASRDGVLVEQVGPLLDEIKAASYRDVLKMVNPGGTRTPFDPNLTYSENEDGTYTLALKNIDYDTMELAASRLGARRWYNDQGYAIEPPINFPEKGKKKMRKKEV